MPATYEPIASITASAGATTLTFSGIPQTFTDLIVVAGGPGDVATNRCYMFVRPNSDSSALYSRTLLDGNGSAASSSRLSGESSWFIGLTRPATAVFQIMSYANTNVFKTALEAGVNNQDRAVVRRAVYLYRSTSAITSLQFLSSESTGVEAGTTLSLYGIKAA